MSEENLFKKIFKVQCSLQKIQKGGTNNFSKYEYARLGDVLDPLRPILFENGLYLVQTYDMVDVSVDYTDKGYHTKATVLCTTSVFDSDETGVHYSVKSIGFAMDKNGDKAVYKAMTGARKYGITSLFCLDWDATDPEDDSQEYFRPDPEEPAQMSRTNKRKVF